MGALKMVKNLLGDNAGTLKQEIDALKSEGAAAYAEIARLEASKLDQDSFAAVKGITSALEETAFKIGVIDRKLPGLEQRLKIAIEKDRAKRGVELTAEYLGASSDAFALAEKAQAAFNAAIAVRAKAFGEGFEREFAMLPMLPHLNGNLFLASDLLDRFWDQYARIDNRQGSKPASRIVQVPERGTKMPVRLPHEAHLVPTINSRRIQPESVPHETAPPLPHEMGPIGADEARCRVVRTGYPDAAGRASQRGRIIKLEKNTAARALENGAIEILQQGPADELRPMMQIDSPSTDVSINIPTR